MVLHAKSTRILALMAQQVVETVFASVAPGLRLLAVALFLLVAATSTPSCPPRIPNRRLLLAFGNPAQLHQDLS